MSNPRNNQILKQFRRTSNNTSHSKDTNRLHYFKVQKETIPPDTSEQNAKSSRETTAPRFQRLEQTVFRLQNENTQLKRQIIELKTSHFFEISPQKIRQAISQIDNLRTQLSNSKKELNQSLVEIDFLKRFNRNLTIQCQTLTREILVLRKQSGEGQNQKNIYTTREEVDSKGKDNRGRHSSRELGTSINKRRVFLRQDAEKEERPRQKSRPLKTSLSSTRISKEYYPAHSSQQNLDAFF